MLSPGDGYRVGRALLGGCRGWLIGAIAAIVLGLVGLVVGGVFNELVWTPWALPIPGRPTLSGRWLGLLRPATGVAYVLYIDLRADPPEGRCARCGTIAGEARLCSSRGTSFAYRLTGDASWSGDRVALLLSTPTGAAPYHELRFTGTWSAGSGMLTLGDGSTFANTFGPNGEPYGATRHEPTAERVRATFQQDTLRGFELACKGITASGPP